MEVIKEFFKAFGQSKLPTLFLIFVLLYFGADIVVKSNKDQGVLIVGGGLVLLAGILGLISFSDYRNKENTDTIIGYYKSALGDISKTHSVIEKTSQNTMTSKANPSTVGASGQYSENPLSETEAR
jgi:hypothetical protein